MPRTMKASNLCAMSAEEFWALRMDLGFDQFQADERNGAAVVAIAWDVGGRGASAGSTSATATPDPHGGH